MKIAKKSNYTGSEEQEPKSLIKTIIEDLQNLFLALQGRIRFGDGGDGDRGENISGEFQQFTSGAANVEFSVGHGLGVIPVGFIPLWQSAAADLYQGPTTGTAWTSTHIYVKSNVDTVGFQIFLLK